MPSCASNLLNLNSYLGDQNIRTVPVNSAAVKGAIFLLIVGYALFTFFAARWGFASSLSSAAEDIELAGWAAQLSPSDPETRFVNGKLIDGSMDPAMLPSSLNELQAAAALSPFNYLIWEELGRAFERSGEQQKALSAYKRALSLAPNYSSIQWSYGNALLRSGDTEQATDLIIKAAEADDRYKEAAAATIWQIFEGDLDSIKRISLKTHNVSAGLVSVLVSKDQPEAAFEIWKGYSEDKMSDPFPAIGRGLYSKLIEKHRYRDAFTVLSDVGELGNVPVPGNVRNGDLETLVNLEAKSIFEWTIAAGELPRIGLTDGKSRSGRFSLLVSFGQRAKDFRSVSQVVAVEPGGRYRLSFFYLADLDTQAQILWEVKDRSSGKRLGSVGPMVTSAEWRSVSVDLTVPQTIDGIEIVLVKECTTSICSVSGNLWMDDILLERTDREK